MTYNFLHYDATDHDGERKEFDSLTEALGYALAECKSVGYEVLHVWRDGRRMATVSAIGVRWASDQARWELAEERVERDRIEVQIAHHTMSGE